VDAVQTRGGDAFANPGRRESDADELEQREDTVMRGSELGKLGV
jgi:hypothetical protein